MTNPTNQTKPIKPIAIICDSTERADLIEWFELYDFKTKPVVIEAHLSESTKLNALEILEDDIFRIARCGTVYAYENKKTLYARMIVDGKVTSEPVTEDNIIILMMTNGEPNLLMYLEDIEVR